MGTKFASFTVAIQAARGMLQYHSKEIHSGMWQGKDIASRPEAAMREIMYFSMDIDLNKNLDYVDQVKPNMPWAEDHFKERVCGEPLNPGVQWRNWPYALRADESRDDNGQFNHSYMERYWPKYAGRTDKGELGGTIYEPGYEDGLRLYANDGIRNLYGDWEDLAQLFVKDPYTRQGYFPVYYPEDTGLMDRKPCTIGYQFFMRDNRMDITYTIRSCDFVRHFRDDIYMTVRLLEWFLWKLQQLDPKWKDVTVGRFRMEIGSLHLFVSDWAQLCAGRL